MQDSKADIVGTQVAQSVYRGLDKNNHRTAISCQE